MRKSWAGFKSRLKSRVESFQHQLQVFQAMIKHPETPPISKILLGIAVGYAVSPIDLIPDFIPVVGHLDDVLVIPALVWMALRFIPAQVKEDCRLNAAMESLKVERKTRGSQMESD
jgi:uncharacterized membrane protein YkvA (DUF1232 family)